MTYIAKPLENKGINYDIETMPSRNPRIAVVMPPDLKAQFEKLCSIRYRSMSNMIVSLVREAVNEAIEKGEIKNEDDSKATS